MYLRKTDRYSSHRIIADIIATQNKVNTKILDLGCDVGFLGITLTKYKHKFDVHGVDINHYNLSIAKKKYNKVYLFNLNDEKWPLKEKFATIVIADTLEHLHKPEEAIKKAIKLLNKGGKLIISVPNIVFWWPRLQVLLGKFPKESRGIFDKTHLHFYTYKTFHDFLSSFTELKIENTYPTNLPLQFVFKKKTNNFIFKSIYNLNYILARIWPNLFAYQLIIMAVKTK